MGKPTKAQITYKVGEGDSAVESTLRFHSVVSEEHEVTTEVTKFPVQSGFDISNHAIKKNKKVTIQGIISNHLIVGATEMHEYGSNNTRVMFSTLQQLVRQATPCEVVTNYGNYSPVIFTKFKTKLMAGKTDSMEFTMSGQEVQLGLTLNQTAPTLLTFTPLTDAERAARVEELLAVGIDVPPEAEVSEARCDMSESFQVQSKNSKGETFTTTYEADSYDPTTKAYSHTMHTSDTKVASAPQESSINWFSIMQEEAAEIPSIDVMAGASTATACLVDGTTGLINETAEDYIDTAVGSLRKSAYGAVYGIVGVNGDQGFGQVLMSLGIDCLVAGAIGSVDPSLNEEDFQENSFPTADEALEGAAAIGDGVATDTLSVAAPTTLTKITPPSGDAEFFGALL